MSWDDLKKNTPQQWVIIEAIEAHTKGGNRIIEKIQPVEMFGEDNNRALINFFEMTLTPTI